MSLALMLGGGGARGAYQAGVLRGIARRYPGVHFPIMTGISAGAINAIHLAAHSGSMLERTESLARLWSGLTPDQVFDIRAAPLLWNAFRWASRLASGGIGGGAKPMRGMVDTQPLREVLTRQLMPDADGSVAGIQCNLDSGLLQAVALSGASYTTGQSVTWVQGRGVSLWQRPQRRSEFAALAKA